MSFEKKTSTRALYLQIRDHLAHEIAAGALRPGAALPNEAELAKLFGVSLGTLRNALEALENERLITRHHGRGTFVRDYAAGTQTPFDNLRFGDGQLAPLTVQLLGSTSGKASAEEQGHLRLGYSDLVTRQRQVRHLEVPIAVELKSIATSRFSSLDPARLAAPYEIAVLAQEHGILLGDAFESVAIAEADAKIAELLAVHRGTPLLKLDRIVYSLDQIPIEWRISYCHLTSVKYVVHLKT